MHVVQSCPRPSTDVGVLQAAVFDVSMQYRGLAFGFAKHQMRQQRRWAQIFRLRRLDPKEEGEEVALAKKLSTLPNKNQEGVRSVQGLKCVLLPEALNMLADALSRALADRLG